ncbi:MAG: YraN family protein [Massiliimalia sp.]
MASWLQKQGAVILERNYSCRFGELDIIAQKGEYLLFVEVKTRTLQSAFYPAGAAVTAAKRKKLILAAQSYCQEHVSSLQPRFDVAEVYVCPDKKARLNYMENAFE